MLELALRDFRDPKVFWHTPKARWVMVVVLPDEHTAQFYASHDLKAWHWLSNFKAAFESAGIWECPDLMPFVTDTGESTWLFKVDVLAGHPSGGSGARLLFGQFDGARFTADAHTAPTWADWGADFYAALSWSAFPGAPQRQLWLAWMSCHRYAQHLPTAPWRGVMSLPRELRVQRSARGLQLLQQPLPALQTLRGVGRTQAALVLEGADGAAEGAAETAAEHELWPEAPNTAIDGRLWGLQIDLQLELQSCTTGRCGVLLRAAADDSGAATVVGYDAARGTVFIDRSHSGFKPPGDPLYAKAREAPVRPPQPDRPLLLRVVLDWSSVEVLVDNGHTVLTEQIFPDHRHRSLRLFAQGGTARFGPTRAWPLQAARYTLASA